MNTVLQVSCIFTLVMITGLRERGRNKCSRFVSEECCECSVIILRIDTGLLCATMKKKTLEIFSKNIKC